MDGLLRASQLLRGEEDYLTSEVGVDMDLAFALRLCPVFDNRVLSLAFSTVDDPLPCFDLKTTFSCNFVLATQKAPSFRNLTSL